MEWRFVHEKYGLSVSRVQDCAERARVTQLDSYKIVIMGNQTIPLRLFANRCWGITHAGEEAVIQIQNSLIQNNTYLYHT